MNEGLVSGFSGRGKLGAGYRLVSLQSTAAIRSSLSSAVANANAYSALLGATTAGELKMVFSNTGPGCLNAMFAYAQDATARTVRIRVTMDDNVVFDTTSAALSTGQGIVAVGAYSSSGDLMMQPLPYTQSLKIEVASSLTETDKVTVAYNHETWEEA